MGWRRRGGPTAGAGRCAGAGNGAQTLSQRPSFQVQPRLRYTFTPRSALSLGNSGSIGGAQRLDGATNGFTAEAHAVGLDYRRFVTDTLQLAALCRANRGFHIQGCSYALLKGLWRQLRALRFG